MNDLKQTGLNRIARWGIRTNPRKANRVLTRATILRGPHDKIPLTQSVLRTPSPPLQSAAPQQAFASRIATPGA